MIALGQENYSTHASHYNSLRPIIEQYIAKQWITEQLSIHSTLEFSTIENNTIHQIAGVCITIRMIHITVDCSKLQCST